MPKTSDKRITIRLKPEEYAFLTAKAGKKPLSTFFRDLALSEAKARRTPNIAAPTKDRQALAQVLALLGKSGLSKSMNDLAESAKLGTLPVTEETEADIQTACADIGEIKSTLMRALGIQER